MHKHNGVLGNLDVLFGLIYKCYIYSLERVIVDTCTVCACDDYIEYFKF